MFQRVMVAVVGVPFLILILCVAPVWATTLLLAALSVVGSHELLTAVMGKRKTNKWWPLAAMLGVVSSFYPYWSDEKYDGTAMMIFPWVFAVFFILVFVVLVREYGKKNALTFRDISSILVGGVLIPLSLSCLTQLRMMEFGGGLVLIPLVSAFCSDTCALFAGMAFGKKKLSPLVSPKKTVEGSLGGLVGGVLGMVLFRIIFFFVTEQPLNILWCMLMGLIGAAMGQLGDLSFSAIKRECEIKDYGRLLPGHGGVLDRFDSVIFASPVIYLILKSITIVYNG